MIFNASIYYRKANTLRCRIRRNAVYWTGTTWTTDPAAAALTTLAELSIPGNVYEDLYYGAVTIPDGLSVLEYLNATTGLVVSQEEVSGALAASVSQGDLQIANMALISLGCKTITAFDDGSTEAQAVSTCYDIIRNGLLRCHNWSFATRRATLSRATAPAFGYAYAYDLPPYCVKVIEATFPDNSTASWNFDIGMMGAAVPFRIEERTILTDESAVNIQYVAGDVTPDGYDVLFTPVLVARLAAELAYPLTQSTTKEDMCWKKFMQLLSQATSADAVEQPAGGLPQSPLIDARSSWCP